VVESAVLMGDVTSPIVSNGEANVLIGFEPLETLRALVKCNRDTLVITNTNPLPPFTVSVGQGEYPPVDEVLKLIRAKVNRLIALKGNELAEKTGNPLSLNMVMLGALIGSGALPVTAESMRETISISTRETFLESNLKAFDLGMEAAGDT
jgi:indolepyruvate ferredoxin oxidoreductase beta subunit